MPALRKRVKTNMKIIDTHCDALLKLQQSHRGKHVGIDPLSFYDAHQIDTNFKRLVAGKVKVQFFAIFIEHDIPSAEKWQHALEQIDFFYTEVIEKNQGMKQIKAWNDIWELKDGEIGAVLTLEGAEAFGNDLMKLRQLYRLGVKSIGLTWNYANLCADGVVEERGAGLTLLGKEVVQLNNQHKVLTDVSHASEKTFWDIMELADYPFASHSNARAICDHPRNLKDDQILSMFKRNGFIHLVFNPPFINEGSTTATIGDLIKHIDHFCSLGGAKKIGFGSDFDGISYYVEGLENAAKYENLINELLKYYSEDDVRGFAYQNFLNNIIQYGCM